MKKIVLFLLITGGLGLLGYSLFIGKKDINTQNAQKVALMNNFERVKSYLIKHYKGNYPIPTGDLILLDKTYSMIHLTDRNIPLSKVKGLYVIQGTICGILKNDKDFQKIDYDKFHSIVSGNKIIFKRCFTYSVTADRKNFQIGTIVKENGKYVAKLDGTIDKSITRSYSSPRLVKNGSDLDLPYPDKLSPVVLVNNLGNSKLVAVVENTKTMDTKKIILKDGVNYLLSDYGKFNIKILGKVNPNTEVKYVDVNGDIVNLQGNEKTNLLSFEIKNYTLEGKKKDYFVQTGRLLANILKLSPDTSMQVDHNGTTLVIRGTKFTVSADKDNFDTFLSLGHIVQLLNGKKIDITLQNAFSLIENSKIIKNLNKAKSLVGFTIFADTLNNPKYDYSVGSLSNSTSILTGISSLKKYLITYSNGQKISLVKVNLPNKDYSFRDFIIRNKNRWGSGFIKNYNKYIDYKKKHNSNALESYIYSGFVDYLCKSQGAKSSLGTSKVWYLFDKNQNDKKSLVPKSKILSSVGLNSNNYMLLFSTYKMGGDKVTVSYLPKSVNNGNTFGYHFALNSLANLNHNNSNVSVIFVCDDN